MLWEYAVETIPADGIMITGSVNSPAVTQRLNQFGALGWELISSYTTSYAKGGTHLLVFIYKRPKDVAPPVAAPTGATRPPSQP